MSSQAPEIFIIYSDEDAEFAIRLAEALKARGVNVWIDRLDMLPGKDFHSQTQDALTRSPRVLAILSPAFVASSDCHDEILFALDRGKTVIPILYRDVEVPFVLASLQRVDFRADADFAGGVEILAKALRADQPAAAQTEAPEALYRLAVEERLLLEYKERKAAAEQARLEEEQREARHKERQQLGEQLRKAAEQALLEEERKAAAEQAGWDDERKAAAEQARLEKKRRINDALEGSRQLMTNRIGEWLKSLYGSSDSEYLPDGFETDNVQFTLTGPSVLVPAQAHELIFWVHVEEQKSDVLTRASAAHKLPASDLSVKSEGPYPLARGSRLSVRLKVKGLNCPDSHKWITWTGEIGSTGFVVEVPRGTFKGTYTGSASIKLNGCEIARMSFVVSVGKAETKAAEIPSSTTLHRTAFASYASEDRAEVLSRVQGMEAAYKNLKVFVDVVDIRSGQNWEQELIQRISESDVFYLFWCHHAMASDWVSMEWHLALGAKGGDFIDPIPLESPQLAPPPKELSDKHFNDPLLAFIAAAGGGHSAPRESQLN